MNLKKIKLSKDNETIVVNILGAFFIKGLGLFLSLFSMPAYIRFFNNDVTLGLWFAVLSVLNWILNFDLGIGNGLRNLLSKTYAENNHTESKKYVSSAYVSVGGFCIAIAAVFFAVFNFVDWNKVFNIDKLSVSKASLDLTIKIVFVGILLQLFLKLISSVIYAIQKSAINNFLNLVTSVIVVTSLSLLPSHENDTNLVVMAIVHVSAVAVPQLIATILIFASKKYRVLSPSFKYFNTKYAKSVLSLGGVFLYVQVVYMLIMSTNEYMITFLVGSEPVVEYQIYYRLFTLIGTLFMLAMTPIWSSVTKALAELNHKWIKSLYKKVFVIGLLCICCNFIVIPASQLVINLWLGAEAITINIFHAFTFAVLGSLIILNSILSTFSNGAGELKTQAVCFTLGAVSKILLSWILVKLFNSWIMVVWATNISLIIYCLIQPVKLKQYLNKLSHKEGE